MIDEDFVCTVCGKTVPPLGYTARNHCNSCLCSLHLDNFPGDRLSTCKGVLRPIGLEKSSKKQQIVFKCDGCGEIKKNIVADDDAFDLIVELSTKPL